MVKPQRRATLLGYEQPTRAGDNYIHQDSTKRQDYFAPRRTQWNLNADSIIQKLNCHTSFPVQEGYELVDLPRFTDALNYQVSEEQQFELWCLEVRRLVDNVNQQEPLQVEGHDEWFGKADREGYLKLDKLATQLSFATRICILDNELLLLEFEPISSNPSNFQISKRELSKFASGPGSSTYDGSIRLKDENDRCYQALVNYVTGTLVRVLLRATSGQFWDDNVVIALAKLATKLKIVGFDLEKSTDVCLSGAREWDRWFRNELKMDFPSPPADKDTGGKSPRDKQLQAAQRTIPQGGKDYFRLMAAFHQCIAVLVQQISGYLRSFPDTTVVTDSFEACSIVYDTGFKEARAVLCQQRSGAIGGSGDIKEVHCVGFAFDVCLEVLEQLMEGQRLSSEGSLPPSTAYVSVHWTWTPILPRKLGDDGIQLGESKIGHIYLASMRDVTTAIVPFLMVCGNFMRQLRGMLVAVDSISKPGTVKMCDDVPFLAAFMLRTSNYRSTTSPDYTSVSLCSIALKRSLGHWNSTGVGDAPASSGCVQGNTEANTKLRSELQAANADMTRVLRKIDSWAIDATSIIIPYRRYCWGTFFLCGLLVVGGLAIGVSVQTRIEGVDPFNISTFCWVLAGFLILVAKSIRVQEWPWRDFFLGRVVCKSVSEVVAVSSVDAQQLLSVLLRLEPVMILDKRGPFEAIFTRRNQETGFAIDVPIGTAALNEGGCFFVKVLSDTGPVFVCLRINYGRPYTSIEYQGGTTAGEEVMYSQRDTPWGWDRGSNKGPLYSLSTSSVTWTRVIGLQCDKAYFD